ncbi:MAG: glycosyltransferase family 39 protein [Patescibacteria group bacterium]|nr:glycosyltransferase family 39 protein [Patescibacteria group bacterium]
MDQARDAMLVHKAYDSGILQLPLLGPRAAGTFLRLGPAFYYFQYISAKIFNSADPAVLAFPDALFSILSIPLFYFFLRLYFKKISSLLAVAAHAFSFLAIEYSRFAWNPNSAPFWILACLYSLAKFSQSETKKGKLLWLGAAAAGLGFASQMHFLVFLTLPMIIAIYFIWSGGWRKLDWKNILLALLILAILYLPMILSEMKTGGDNMKQFIFALKNKSNADYSLKDKIFQNIFNHGNYYFMLLTSYMSRTGKFSMIAGIVFVTATLLKMFFGLRDEKDKNKRNFLKLISVWFAIIFFVLILFAFQIRPRFFFPVFFLPFVFFAFWLEWLLAWKKKYWAFGAAILISFAVIALNAEATYAWYKSFAKQEELRPLKGRFLAVQPMHGVALSHLEAAADFLDSRSKSEGRQIHLYGDMTFRVPLQYLMEIKNPPTDYKLMSRKDTDQSALYFSMTADKDGYTEIPENYRIKFDLENSFIFGQRLQLFEMKLKEIQPEYKKGEKNSGEKKKPRARRKERVKWENVF